MCGEIHKHIHTSLCAEWRRGARNTSHDVSGPVIGKSASPAPGVSNCASETHPGVQPTTPACYPLPWVCAHQIITSLCVYVLFALAAAPSYLAAGAINIAVSRARYCPMRITRAVFCVASFLLSLFISLARTHPDIWTEWLRERANALLIVMRLIHGLGRLCVFALICNCCLFGNAPIC